VGDLAGKLDYFQDAANLLPALGVGIAVAEVEHAIAEVKVRDEEQGVWGGDDGDTDHKEPTL
jgi:hypothetical protein